MVKKELMQLYMGYKQIQNESQAKREVEDFIEVMKLALERDDVLVIRDFGTFHIKTTKRETAFNPRTGEPVKCTPRKYIKFEVGKELEDRINAPKTRGRRKKIVKK